MITLKMVRDAAWELLIEQYQAGASLEKLAKGAQMHHSTLSQELKRRGVFVEGRKNRAKSDECAKGHDLKIHGVQKFTKSGAKNGRECSECKRERQRV